MQRILALVALLVVVLTSVIAWSSLRMNLSEIAWQLQKQEFVEGNLSRMYLIARFVDQRKLYQEIIDRGTLDRNEYDITQLLSIKERKYWATLKTVDFLDQASLRIVNTLRRFIGKPPIAEPLEIKSLEYLEFAFHLEQVKEYERALGLYAKADAMISDPSLRGMLLLHQGFCNAFLGNIDEAKEQYLRVIQLNRHNEQSVTAGLLLQHLEQIVVEQSIVKNSSFPELMKARKMSLLMQCKDVLNSLKNVKTAQPKDYAEVLMIRGLCEEETGNKQQALKDYLGVIEAGGLTSIAKDANRRVFIMGAQIQNGSRLEVLAKKINKSLGDTLLEELINAPHSEVSSLSRSSPLVPDKVMNELETKAVQLVEAHHGNKVPESVKGQVEKVAQSSILPPKASVRGAVVNTAIPAKMAKDSSPANPADSGPGVHSYIKVLLKNGKSFSGEVLSTPDEQVMRIKTLIGVIGVRKADIQEMKSE